MTNLVYLMQGIITVMGIASTNAEVESVIVLWHRGRHLIDKLTCFVL